MNEQAREAKALDAAIFAWHDCRAEGPGAQGIAMRAAIDAYLAALSAQRQDHTEMIRKPSRDEIADEVCGIQVGSGYYATVIGRDAALEAADAVLALFKGGDR